MKATTDSGFQVLFSDFGGAGSAAPLHRKTHLGSA